MNQIKQFFANKIALRWAIVLLVALQPIIDMDYLIHPFLDQFSIPRFSTIIRFLIIPALIVWTFFLADKNKKKTLLIGIIYGVLMLGWFVLHGLQAIEIYDRLYLTTNFYFNWFQELTYVLTLILPYGLIYCVTQLKFKENIVKCVIVFLAGFIGVSILLSNLYVFSISTYEGNTVANIFTWFAGIYDHYHPRFLASKFFFNEGNTIGILMTMLLLLMYYFFAIARSIQEKCVIGSLLFILNISMMILGTRTATYGTLLMGGAFLAIYLFDALISKNWKVKKLPIVFALVVMGVSYLILPYTPAVQNQNVDAVNDLALINNGAISQSQESIQSGGDLIPGTTEFNHFYIYQFEEYGIRAKMATSIPSSYYMEWYSYIHDPLFWCNVVINMPVEDRVSGRQIQTIFTTYKWQELDNQEKMLGMGYSTLMNGSIVLEQDFVQQSYTLGYVGVALTLGPWVLLTLAGVALILFKFKVLVRLDIMILGAVVVFGFGAAYTSGHTLDQFLTTVFLSFITGYLISLIQDAYRVGKDND